MGFITTASLLHAGNRLTLSASISPRISSTSQTTKTPQNAIRLVSSAQLTQLLELPPPVVVLKCYAPYCRGCKGVESKYRKIAAAYQSRVTFCEMDYAANTDFCRDCLGVKALPFFAVWKDGHLVAGEPMGWQTVTRRLVHTIDEVINLLPIAPSAASTSAPL